MLGGGLAWFGCCQRSMARNSRSFDVKEYGIVELHTIYISIYRKAVGNKSERKKEKMHSVWLVIHIKSHQHNCMLLLYKVVFEIRKHFYNFLITTENQSQSGSLCTYASTNIYETLCICSIVISRIFTTTDIKLSP